MMKDSYKQCNIIIIIKLIKLTSEKIAAGVKFCCYMPYAFCGNIEAMNNCARHCVKDCLRKYTSSAAVIQQL